MKRIWKLAPYLVLLGGFALRLYRLGANSLWYDETVSVYLAQSDLGELLRHTAGDIHPPFYYIVLHVWGRVAGWSEFAMAFLSLWLGVLMIGLVYRVTRAWSASLPRNTNALWAGLAEFLVAVSAYNVWYSQEVRMYTLGATLGLLSVYFLRRMLQTAKPFARDFFGYVLVTVLGFYTLYYFIFLMVFEWLWVANRVWRIANRKSRIADRKSLLANRALLSTFLLSQVALVVVYLPWLPIAFRQATDPPVPPWREFIALPRVVLETFSALAFGQAVDWNVFGIVALLLCLCLAALFWRDWQVSLGNAQENPVATGDPRPAIGDARYAIRAPRSALRDPRYAIRDTPSAIRDTPSPFFLLGYFLIPLAGIYLFSLWKPLYHVRYMFTYSPAFYIFAALGMVNVGKLLVHGWRAKSMRLVYGLGTVAILVSIGFLGVTGYSLSNFWTSPQYVEDDLRGAVGYIADHWRPGDVILVNAGYAYPAVTLYFPQALTRERLVNYQPSNLQDPLLLQTGSMDGGKNLGWGDPRSDFYATTPDETRAALDRVFHNYSRVWMLRIYDTVVDPEGVIRSYFDSHATILADEGFTGESQARVQGFLTLGHDVPPGATRVDKNLGDRVQLVGYETGARELTRGAFFDAVLYWKLSQSVNYNYQVTLQLLNAKGENVAQYDEMPLSEFVPMTRWNTKDVYREPLRLKIPAELTVGEYHAIVKLYEPRSGEVIGDVIELGSIQIR